ncbi:MAG: prephenate/arogenate dehydrogenase family protein [Rhodospirillaceae bacterium]|nr:prephenate/arogenate dehydrogenase family protein [Rhodospirillaceae bacterium]
MADVLFEKVAFIGVGLIGSSMARRMSADGLMSEIVACARSEETRTKVVDLGIASQTFEDPAAAVDGADLVVIATPIGSCGAIAQAIAPALKPGAIVTDVGSVKQAVVDAVAPYLSAENAFVPGHPIAGTEESGPEAGFPELFDGRWTILTPTDGTDAEAVEKVKVLWQRMGAMVDTMTPSHHDMVLAITSHLPHLIAYTIVGTATDLEDDLRQEVMKYSASGFRDFTRIAASDPVMWRDIFLNNRDSTLETLQRFSEDLTALQRAIRRGEGDVLEELFARTRKIRRGIIDAKQAY